MSRETLLPLLAAHVMEHGLADASLRPLARAAGTSDRMLIYHFGNKDALMAALLEHLAGMFAAALDSAFPRERSLSRRACAETVYAVSGRPEFAPFFRVWWDIVSGCSNGDRAYIEAAARMMDLLLAWVVDHLPLDDPDPEMGARAVMTVIEGSQMLRAVGREDIGEAGLATLEG
ncbi:TetR/AcrR family transcriptional regulator [Qipengyuania qiaonensis]|uniref:TetR/AcrR family transcriptional regulator n=1 Tax=Qipengyuania qiaonensis TaxID=2867240 RepID=A0ABS7J5L9_9SPHN|nr:TetR/AcrR family transcriptional regulator [Qipengyuania qiaonensis]MBX7482634.1 TetR/AcrR family transcriptional regulator [Qipengyuania qiaonensis]